MTFFERCKSCFAAEQALPLWRRQQHVPCGFCRFGGNGEKSCELGGSRLVALSVGCFKGQFLENEPQCN